MQNSLEDQRQQCFCKHQKNFANDSKMTLKKENKTEAESSIQSGKKSAT